MRNKLRKLISTLLAVPDLSRMVPIFHDDSFIPAFDKIKNQSEMTVADIKKIHKEQLAMHAAQIDEQRQANQHNLIILHRTLLISIVSVTISILSFLVASLAVIISAVK